MTNWTLKFNDQLEMIKIYKILNLSIKSSMHKGPSNLFSVWLFFLLLLSRGVAGVESSLLEQENLKIVLENYPKVKDGFDLTFQKCRKSVEKKC